MNSTSTSKRTLPAVRFAGPLIGIVVVGLIGATAYGVYVAFTQDKHQAMHEADARMKHLDAEARQLNAHISKRLAELLGNAHYDANYHTLPATQDMGVNRTQLQRAVAGEYPLSHEQLIRICAYFDISMADFLDDRLPAGFPASVIAFVKLRLNAGLSPAEFARSAGLSSEADVRAIEAGTRDLTAAEWLLVREAFGASPVGVPTNALAIRGSALATPPEGS